MTLEEIQAVLKTAYELLQPLYAASDGRLRDDTIFALGVAEGSLERTLAFLARDIATAKDRALFASKAEEGQATVTKGKVVLQFGDGGEIDAEVLMASASGGSLMLQFEGIVDGHVGMMPLLREDGQYRSIMTGKVYTLVMKPA